MIRNESLLTLALLAMLVALLSMLTCLAWPVPWTIGAFLGPGLMAGGAGIVLYVLYVLRDLRTRGAL
ncbi:MAG TPA: hypothetical protein VGK30_01025 [Candidatus Binatia bacterium]|jgi:hypothetical protein